MRTKLRAKPNKAKRGRPKGSKNRATLAQYVYITCKCGREVGITKRIAEQNPKQMENFICLLCKTKQRKR